MQYFYYILLQSILRQKRLLLLKIIWLHEYLCSLSHPHLAIYPQHPWVQAYYCSSFQMGFEHSVDIGCAGFHKQTWACSACTTKSLGVRHLHMENRIIITVCCWTPTPWVQKRVGACKEGCEQLTDVSLMFAPSTAEWAAEDHVKTIQWPPQDQVAHCL